MKDKRPKNLDLFTMRFPITAIASICHRISGVFLFLLLPVLLWIFAISLESAEGFSWVYNAFTNVWFMLLVWAFLSFLGYHMFGGIRHMVLELGIVSETYRAGKITAIISWCLSIIWIILIGVWLWL